MVKNQINLLLIALSCLLLTHAALAGIVTNNADSGPGSLRTVIAQSGNGDIITFDPSVTGVIALRSGDLEINHTLTIIGPGSAGLTINGDIFFEGQSNFRMFNINSSSATVTISGLTISGGYATGGLSTNNGASGQGGGIFNAGNLTLTNCTLENNHAYGGDGDSSSNNSKGGDGLGGAIFNSGALTLVNCLIENNVASGGQGQGDGGNGLGGGICSQGSGAQVALTNCTLNGNSATGGEGVNGGLGGGGGIYIIGVLTENMVFIVGSVVNCTVASNSATGGFALFNSGADTGGEGEGGGVFIDDPGLALISCTISGNTAAGGFSDANGGDGLGGGIYASLNPSTVENTIVGGNDATVGGNFSGPSGYATGYDVHGSVTSGGFNLISKADEENGWIASDLIPAEEQILVAQLGPLQDNGGPTPTMALLLTSPAIDQGTNFGINTDQRGQLRPNDFLNIPNAPGGDGSDIGAFELYPSPPHLKIHFYRTTNSVPSTGNGYSGVVYVSHANSSPGIGAQRNMPIFLWQTVSALVVSNPPSGNQWSAYKGHVRLINGEWVARDPVVAGSAFYGLVNLTNNNYLTNAYYPPDITLSASNIMTASATLDGSDFPSESNTVYWFEYGTDPNNYAGMTQPTPLATSDNPAILSCSVVGLNPSTLYHFQLVVTNDWSVDTGPELGGDQTFTTLDPVPAVNTWAASSITATSATLNGNVSADGPAAANAYFEYGVDTNQNDLQYSTTYFPPGDIYFHAYSYNATGLTPSTTYYYQAVAFNNSHTGYGAWSNFTTVALQPPAVVTTNATYVSCGGDCAPIPVLNGTVNGNGSSFTGYFQYGLSSNGTITYSFDTSQHPFSGNNNSPQIFNFTMTNVTLNASTTYHYRIVAFNGASEGVGGDQTFLSP